MAPMQQSLAHCWVVVVLPRRLSEESGLLNHKSRKPSNASNTPTTAVCFVVTREARSPFWVMFATAITPVVNVTRTTDPRANDLPSQRVRRLPGATVWGGRLTLGGFLAAQLAILVLGIWKHARPSDLAPLAVFLPGVLLIVALQSRSYVRIATTDDWIEGMAMFGWPRRRVYWRDIEFIGSRSAYSTLGPGLFMVLTPRDRARPFNVSGRLSRFDELVQEVRQRAQHAEELASATELPN